MSGDTLLGNLDNDEKALYVEIWKRAVTSQLTHAEYSNTTITFNAGSPLGQCLFTAKSKECTDPGFHPFSPPERLSAAAPSS